MDVGVNMKFPVVAITAVCLFVAACQTDKVRYKIGRTEPATPPEVMFAAKIGNAHV